MPRKLNNIKRKSDILKLRKKGLSYKQIAKKLGCSLSIISYHCGNGSEKERVKNIYNKNTPKDCIARKLNTFKSRMKIEKIRNKYVNFRRAKRNRRITGKDVVNNIKKNYTKQDVIDKIGEHPVCYLTGRPIDLCDTKTYQFDHIVPVSKGGTNDLSNLGVCRKEANQAKGELSVKEPHKLCKEILSWKSKKM